MPPLTPTAVDRLVSASRAAAAAPHGQRQAHWQSAARDLGVSLQTALRWRKEISVGTAARKRRSDAGQTALTRDEALLISATLVESHRRNGKRLLAIEQAVDMLRANGMIRAETLDPKTGEVAPLSVAAIARALRAYELHPDNLTRDTPSVSLASRHPNHCWQIDASLCVLYYLRTQAAAKDAGLQVMPENEFYKNKPGNLARIENERVWRYAITDHTSGHIYVQYVLGAESGENLCHCLIEAMTPRPGEPVHGVPLMVMLDPGSANTGALFKTLCRNLGVVVQINEVGNPRAKGQVEKAHDQIEKSFESGLKFVTVNSLAELNAAAAKWRQWFNGTRKHTRHGLTRYAAWMRITADQLRIAPEPAVLRELATSAPESRLVDGQLQVSFRGRKYSVSDVPDVQNGSTVMVCRNPWRPEGAQIVATNDAGREVFYPLEPVAIGEWGFAADAIVIGERYARHADTAAQGAAKEAEKLLMGADTLDVAEALRKGKALAFKGELDPWKHMGEDMVGAPTYMPRRGTALDTPLPGVAARRTLDVPPALAVEARRLNPVQLAGRLSAAMPGSWTADHYRRLTEQYPDGAAEDAIPEILDWLRGSDARRLVAVGGGK